MMFYTHNLVLLLEGIFCAGLCYVLLVVGYRLTIHPLAAYPGPFLAKVTNWRAAYYMWIGESHIESWKMHEKYGNFVRTAPNVVSTNTVTALKEIYGNNKNIRKSPVYTMLRQDPKVLSVHNALNKQVHGLKRRVLSQAFSDKALKGVEERMLTSVRLFCAELTAGTGSSTALTDEWNSAHNMAEWSNYLAFDILGSLCFSSSFGMLEREENRYIAHTGSNLGRRNATGMAQPKIIKYRLDMLLLLRIGPKLFKFLDWTKEQAQKRAKIIVQAQDFFSCLLCAEDPVTGKGFTEEELYAESTLLIVAGSDTSSTALASTYFYLLHNPESISCANAEVRSQFKNVEEVCSGHKLDACVYLRACLDEALRLSPPVSSSLPRQVLHNGITIDGHHFPAGVDIGTSIYCIHHNAAYFPQPFLYKPSRWIPGENITAESVRLARSAFCPFSIGPRGCIARNMVYMELMITLARSLYLYDMRLQPGSTRGEGNPGAAWGRHRPGEYQIKDWFTAHKDGPMVEFRRRATDVVMAQD